MALVNASSVMLVRHQTTALVVVKCYPRFFMTTLGVLVLVLVLAFVFDAVPVIVPMIALVLFLAVALVF